MIATVNIGKVYLPVLNKLSAIIGKENIRVNEPMSAHTTFKIGGPCDYFVSPATVEQIKDIILLCKSTDTPFFILGNGSNLLVSDAGYRGVVISISDNLSSYNVENTIITAQAGAKLVSISNAACKNSLSGLEFAAGIPGTVGGGVIMNAGAYGGEIKQVIKSAVLMNTDGDIFRLNRDELELSYRNSRPARENMIVLEAEFELTKGKAEEISSLMKDYNQRRRDKQPVELPSAGSTFKRPEGYFAGKLIQDAGLSGKTIGGACVSPKHNGFVVNNGGATAKDVIDLIEYIRTTVMSAFGVELCCEVKFLGF